MTDNLNFTVIAENQVDQFLTVNTIVGQVDAVLTQKLEVDLTSANVTLTENQFARNAVFNCSNNTVSRSLILPTTIARTFYVKNNGTVILNITKGTTTLTLGIGKAAAFYSDDTTNGLITLTEAAGSGGGGGVTAFTALTDAPASYSGQAGKGVRVNTGASALEFYTISAGFSGDYADLTGKPTLFDGVFASLTSKPTTIAGYGITDAFNGTYASLTGKPTLFSGAYVDLTGKPTLGTAAAIDVGTTANKVVQLTAAGKLPAVDGSLLTGLSSGVTAFTGLSDVPSSYTGQALKGVRVNSAATALEFFSISGGFSGIYSDLTGIPSTFTPSAHTHPVADISDASANARSFLQASNYAAMRTALGVAIGTNVQAYDAELTALAGLTSGVDQLPYFTGSGTAAITTLTSYGRSLIDDADATTARATLGLGTSATVNTGTTANSIVQLNGSAQLPAVDGSLLINLPTVTAGFAINNQTLSSASYTLVLSDAGKYIRINTTNSGNVIIPPNSSVAFAIGTQILVGRVNTGTTTINAGSGVTINTADSASLKQQYSSKLLTKVATDTWDIATFSIAVGTSANNILQLDSAGKIPALDGSQLTLLPNLETLADVVGTNFTGSAPLAGQMLGWNSSFVQWQPLYPDIDYLANATAAGKAMVKAANVTAQTALLNVATTSVAGLMAAGDKTRLDALADPTTGAMVSTQAASFTGQAVQIKDSSGNVTVSFGGDTASTTASKGQMALNNPGTASVGAAINFATNGANTAMFQLDSTGQMVFRNTTSAGSMYFDVISGNSMFFRMRSANTTPLTITATAATYTVPVKLPSYTVAGMPSASTLGAGTMIYVSNATGGAVMAFSNGTNWLRCDTSAIVT